MRVVVVGFFVMVWSVVLVLVIVLGSESGASLPQAAKVPTKAMAAAVAIIFRRMTWEFLWALGEFKVPELSVSWFAERGRSDEEVERDNFGLSKVAEDREVNGDVACAPLTYVMCSGSR